MERADAVHLHIFLPGQAQVLRINIVYDDNPRCDVPPHLFVTVRIDTAYPASFSF